MNRRNIILMQKLKQRNITYIDVLNVTVTVIVGSSTMSITHILKCVRNTCSPIACS